MKLIYKFSKAYFSFNHSLLGLNSTCSRNEIKTSYYKLSKQYHPDLNNGVNSERYIEVQKAYNELMKEYDYREKHEDDIDVLLNKLRVQSKII
jgi:curved DNA-binding protein CbpA